MRSFRFLSETFEETPFCINFIFYHFFKKYPMSEPKLLHYEDTDLNARCSGVGGVTRIKGGKKEKSFRRTGLAHRSVCVCACVCHFGTFKWLLPTFSVRCKLACHYVWDRWLSSTSLGHCQWTLLGTFRWHKWLQQSSSSLGNGTGFYMSNPPVFSVSFYLTYEILH